VVVMGGGADSGSGLLKGIHPSWCLVSGYGSREHSEGSLSRMHPPWRYVGGTVSRFLIKFFKFLGVVLSPKN
jgi:hypothetical protein